MAVHRAQAEGLSNFSVLVAHVLVPPALEALLSAEGVLIQALLAPGHVCTVTGYRDYEPVAAWSTRDGASEALSFWPATAADAAHPRSVNLVVVDAATGRPVQAVKVGC
jgi:hypothetical protein